MKRNTIILFFAIAVFIFGSCTSSKKYLELQQYDNAIEKSVKKLSKKPNNPKEIDILNRSYSIANQQDNERIIYLRTTGQPNIWDEIFQIYSRLKRRQENVHTLPLSILSKIGFKYIDYTQETVNAQFNAAEYYYQSGLMLLKSGDRFSARKAYQEFKNAQSFFANYKDSDKQIRLAIEMGTSKVLFNVKNNSQNILPEGFINEVLKIQLSDIEKRFLQFYTNSSIGIQFNYFAVLSINSVEVSPESVREVIYDEKKEVQDGWNYVLDSRGNVVKDSLGNDIKTPRMVNIVCNVREIQMHKQALVGGTLDIYDAEGTLLKTDPISAETFFDYVYGYANGNVNILKSETKKIISRQKINFPNDLNMIWDAAEIVKNISKDIVKNNSYLFQ